MANPFLPEADITSRRASITTIQDAVRRSSNAGDVIRGVALAADLQGFRIRGAQKELERTTDDELFERLAAAMEAIGDQYGYGIEVVDDTALEAQDPIGPFDAPERFADPRGGKEED
jgi:hypothetical protein